MFLGGESVSGPLLCGNSECVPQPTRGRGGEGGGGRWTSVSGLDSPAGCKRSNAEQLPDRPVAIDGMHKSDDHVPLVQQLMDILSVCAQGRKRVP